MDFLPELIRLVTYKRNTKRLEKAVFDLKENKQLTLFQTIRADKNITDEIASDLVYGCSSKAKKYLQLKNNLRKKMLNLLLQVDLKVLFKTKYARKIINVRRNLLIGQILLLLNLRSEAVYLLREVLKSALDLNLTDVILTSAKHLRYCSTISCHKRDYDYYHSIILKYQNLLVQESLAEHYSNDLIMKISQSTSERADLINISNDYYEQLKSIMADCKSHNIILEYFRVGIRYYNIRRDYINVMEICKKFEDYLESNPNFKRNNLLFEINANRMEACLYTMQYLKGIDYSRVCLKLVNPKTTNWLIIKEYQFLLAMHTGNLNQASKYLEDVKYHPKYKDYPVIKHEKWKLFELYLIILSNNKEILKDFRIARWLNEFTVYYHDKKGHYLSLVIIEILYFLKIERYSLVEDKIDPLKIYLYRYIKKENQHRSYCFIRMLLLLPKYEFNREKVRINTNKYLEDLKNSTTLESMEVIPYERIWDIILSNLKQGKALDKELKFSIQLKEKQNLS